jgi:O-methyltransferase involved in polyketide biosynthesis
VSQVIEIAAGYSPRGFRFARRFPQLSYVEGDLAPMALAKRARLDSAGLRADNLDVRPLDALVDQGPESIAAVADGLDRTRGTAVVTEGLLGYLAPAAVAGLWRRVAAVLRWFPRGLYLSDVYLANQLQRSRSARAFRLLLQALVRGRTYAQVSDEASAQSALTDAGFARASLHEPPGKPVVRILEAWTAAHSATPR